MKSEVTLLKSIISLKVVTANLVFECNFDNGACSNGPFAFNQSTNYGGIIDYHIISGTVYRVTDVSSINNSTLNGQKCKIPFTELGNEYNYCFLSTNFVCQTTEGGKDQCKLGKYLMGKTLSTGDPISSRGTSSEIVLPGPGLYEIKFYILMFTNLPDMTIGGDYIQVGIQDNSIKNVAIEKYDYTNIGKPNAWNEKSFRFQVMSSNIKILVDFVRESSTGKFGIFGFDQLEIFKIDDTSVSIITSTRQSLVTITPIETSTLNSKLTSLTQSNEITHHVSTNKETQFRTTIESTFETAKKSTNAQSLASNFITTYQSTMNESTTSQNHSDHKKGFIYLVIILVIVSVFSFALGFCCYKKCNSKNKIGHQSKIEEISLQIKVK